MAEVLLKDIAYARSGDKGDVSNIGVLAQDEKAWEIIRRELTPEAIKAHFRGLVTGKVNVYEMPNLRALNIVMEGALGGGATNTLRYDQTGKALSTAILRMKVRTDG